MTNTHTDLSDYFLSKLGGAFPGDTGRAVADELAADLVALGYVKPGEDDTAVASEAIDACITSNEMGEGYIHFRLDNDDDPLSLVADRYDDDDNPQNVTSTHRITIVATKL